MLEGLRMQRVTFHVMTDEVPQTALALARTGSFSPDMGNQEYENELPEAPATEYRNLYQSANNRLSKIHEHLGVTLPRPSLKSVTLPELETLRVIDHELMELWAECSECEEHQRELDEEIHLIDSLLNSLHNFYGLEINLAQLREQKTFLDLQVGLVPVENLARLRQAAGLAGYMVEVFHREKQQAHIVLAGLAGEGKENIESVLRAAGYRTFPIPEAFNDTPENMYIELEKRKQLLLEDMQRHDHKRIVRGNENMDNLLSYWRALKLVEPVYLLGDAAHSRGGLAVIHGWVPEAQLADVIEQLRKTMARPFHVENHPPKIYEYASVPTAIRYPAWLKPFVSLTRNYGTPRYGEVDPTWLFALSSILLFGIMFGDVGQGATLVVASYIFRNVLKSYAYLIGANGLSSIVFGFVYGSVFGNEHLLTPLWQSPLHEPSSILLVAIYIGVAFIALSITINIYNNILVTDYHRALMSPGGLPSLIAISSVILYAISAGQNLFLPGLLLFASLLMMMQYLWVTNNTPTSERVVVVSIELLETLLSLFSNILSFLRVGAFSLNHVALMLAVFAIAEMLPENGYWLMMILGNLFVIGFEGAIVMIQVLRLEYYEGLSRYFQADGRMFRPLKLDDSEVQYRYT
jgi:V/A-type H+-transporting ATPase subunit I